MQDELVLNEDAIELAARAYLDHDNEQEKGIWGRVNAAMRGAIKAYIRAAPPAPEWFDITDAPTGVEALIYYKNSCDKDRVIKAICMKKHTEQATDYNYDGGDYCEEKDEFFMPEGWYELIDNWDDFSHVKVHEQPTHYQPLPLPPKIGNDVNCKCDKPNAYESERWTKPICLSCGGAISTPLPQPPKKVQRMLIKVFAHWVNPNSILGLNEMVHGTELFFAKGVSITFRNKTANEVADEVNRQILESPK